MQLQQLIQQYTKNESRYERKGISSIKKYLKRENIYNFLSVNVLLKGIKYYPVPMYRLKMSESLDYMKTENFLSMLVLDKQLLFHNIFLFRNYEFLGEYTCSEIGECGVSLYKDSPDNFKNYLEDLRKIEINNHDFCFYVRGVLHAWWLIKGNEVKVYSLYDGNFYTPQQFLEQHFSNEKLKNIIKYISKIGEQQGKKNK